MPLGQLSSALWRHSCELSLHPPSFAWSVKQPMAFGRAAVLTEVTVAWLLLVCNYKQTPVSFLGLSISLECMAHTQAQQLHAIKVDGVTASVTGPLVQLSPRLRSPIPQGRNHSPAKLCLMNLSGITCLSSTQLASLLLTLSGQCWISDVVLEDYKAVLTQALLTVLCCRFWLTDLVWWGMLTLIGLCKQELADWLVRFTNTDFACTCRCARTFDMHPNKLLCLFF